MKEYNIVGASNDEVHDALIKKYGDNPDHLSYAEQVAVIAGDYSRNLPKGLSKEEKSSRRTMRRNAKRAIYAKAKEQIKPVGFIGTFIFLALISGIISWIVQKMLSHYFSDTPKAMFCPDTDDEVEEVDDDSAE